MMILDLGDRLHEESVLALIAQYSYQPTPEKMKIKANEYANDSAVRVFGCMEGDRPVGIIVLRQHGEDQCQIVGIAVDPARRGAGIGASLIACATRECACATLVAETDDDAVGFYRSYGFTIESLGEKYPGTVRYLCTWRRRETV